MPPLSIGDMSVCMGSSVSSACGFSRASEQKVAAFIGDSTFFHSGITGLINAVHNNHTFTLVIMDNGTTAMTGHQPNPGVPGNIKYRLRLHSKTTRVQGINPERVIMQSDHSLLVLLSAGKKVTKTRFYGEKNTSKFDKLVKSLPIVMPDLIRHPEPIEFTGFQRLPRTTIRGSPE